MTGLRMNRLSASLLIIFLFILVGFGTWQLYAGNIEAAFSTLPFLLIMYLYVMSKRR